ncbi:hypothetical protein NP233_g4369 [Leucocoprinus birnbaumii]|uniref:Uncharacterized protein n=1 Tax=Leucocoprinus birnbaumii TaxID=56174 RepID=A0AAD5YXM9_9AGAR|nr:hypothetical protein NP233_g4369 [Leucocoprinus birnbaumii]
MKSALLSTWAVNFQLTTMPDPPPTITLQQQILPGHKGSITARYLHMNDLSVRDLDKFLSSAVDGKIGVAPAYDTKQALVSIAFATNDQVLVVKVATKNFSNRTAVEKRALLQKRVFMNASLIKYAFHMDKVATSLFLDMSLHIVAAVDILSCLPRERHLFLTKIEALGGEPTAKGTAVKDLFRQEESSKAERTVIAAQAWAAYRAALLGPSQPSVFKIDTTIFSPEEMTYLAMTIRIAEQLTGLQPVIAQNDIDDDYSLDKGMLQARSSRFTTRLRELSSNQRLRVEVSTPTGRKIVYKQKVDDLNGRSMKLALTSGTSGAQKVKLFTEGRDNPTTAEALRTNVLLEVLQGRSAFFTLPFVKYIWFPNDNTMRPPNPIPAAPIPVTSINGRGLNKSQIRAVKAVLSPDRVVLIQGPPGTGKTTVIAAAVLSLIQKTGRAVWLIAQSNVAVKNIAEKLADSGFIDFKLLVSKDFHYDWHEHLYEEIIHNVLRSDDFAHHIVGAERQLEGSKVILCTLSMLSNNRISLFTRVVPPTLFIFDEASQIEVGCYVPIVHRFQGTMEKLVFIGDDKQLPPYGQNDIKGLQSVFELSHIQDRALFLDTQYRMPLVIGKVISQAVYKNRLQSIHQIATKTCCRFVNVATGRESRQGKSWVNEEQSKIAITLARRMQELGYSYRIISPYDAQRTLMENSLKSTPGLDWENKVFNVDSFQGNEDDYIIICLVRTERIGFLKDIRRVNVMLTRCKKGMFICTDKSFLHGAAKTSLVAKLEKAIGSNAWVQWQLKRVERPFLIPILSMVRKSPIVSFTFEQTVLPSHKSPTSALFLHLKDLSRRVLNKFLLSAVEGKIGVAPVYGEKRTLLCLAFATRDQVLVVKVTFKNSDSDLAVERRKLLETRLLLNPDLLKYAFYMDRLCTSLFLDLSLRIAGAVDILSCYPGGRHLHLTKIQALGDEPTVDGSAMTELFRNDELLVDNTVVATQAWAAFQAALILPPSARQIDTTIFSSEASIFVSVSTSGLLNSSQELMYISKTIRVAERLVALRPLVAPNEIEDDYSVSQGQLTARSSRFSTRVRGLNSNQRIRVEFSTLDGSEILYKKKLDYLNGRMMQLTLSNGKSDARDVKLFTEGRDNPTCAEASRTDILLEVLQNQCSFLTLPFVRDIWLPSKDAELPSTSTFDEPVPVDFDARPLNASQLQALEAILSSKPSNRIVLIQGPPGTGKTTLISAAVMSIISGSAADGVWLIAQSNVAVKNMAEKLADPPSLLSSSFRTNIHAYRHEHLYEEIISNVIRSDDFGQAMEAAEKQLLGSRVVLCTLSMLSNDRIALFTKLVPPTLFVFDEATQIEVGCYIPMLQRFQKTMRKLVFIGDDKQLPPYGQNEIEDLRSVFEIPHLREHALFLDTQYRMPLLVGNYISREVYDSRLKSVHSISTNACCRFVDVVNGQEQRMGKSWINVEQNKIAVALAEKIEFLARPYRIITPYDAQRALIENSLKKAGLNWRDKVFNVDSFQGNEDDFIIICLVRTDHVGFLRDKRRVNVMLTRCKRGMVICTDRNFLNEVAKDSLVTRLANATGNAAWVDWQAVLQPDFYPFLTLY